MLFLFSIAAGFVICQPAEGHRFEPCNFHHQALAKVSAFSFSLLQRDFAGRTRRVCATPYPGKEFFAEPHRGVALCGARKLPLLRRGQKGRDTCGLISAGAAIDRHSPIPNKKCRGRKSNFFLPLLCPVKRYLLYHLWFAVYRNE